MEKIALIPAYNEEKNIREVVKRVKKSKILPIVIDDHSSDKTHLHSKKAGAIVIRHDTNKGKAEAIKTGLNFVIEKYPKSKYYVLIDADMQYLPEESVKLIKHLKEGRVDLVTGYRDWSKIPFRHRLGNFVWRTAFNLIFGTKFKDTNCGFVAMNKKTALVMREIIYGGYILENAIFIKALKKKLKVVQVPVTVVYKEKSKIPRGIRTVLGVFIFITLEGVKYRLSRK